MEDFEKLLENLRILLLDLKQESNGASKYIENIIYGLTASPDSEDQRKFLIQIKSSGKIIDYANFNKKQEDLWAHIWRKTRKIIKNMK